MTWILRKNLAPQVSYRIAESGFNKKFAADTDFGTRRVLRLKRAKPSIETHTSENRQNPSNPRDVPMRELNADNVIDYLRETGRLEGDAEATLLTGGVSNVVLRISPTNGPDFVLKQSRKKLQTAADWQSRLERIWREADVMRTLCQLLLPRTIPAVLFEDRDNYLFAMEAIEPDHVVWKTALLQSATDNTAPSPPQAATIPPTTARGGEGVNEKVTILAATALARIHSETAGVSEYRDRWSDITVFDELRLDPYYRFIARRHPQIQSTIDTLIEQTTGNAICVVSADFSPKNILITRGSQAGIALVDFETAHYGDPAFDLGFFLTHLLCKSVYFGEDGGPLLDLAVLCWRTYLEALSPVNSSPLFAEVDISRRTARHLAACLLARVDGKSPVEYLDKGQQALIRRNALPLFDSDDLRVEDVFARFQIHQ